MLYVYNSGVTINVLDGEFKSSTVIKLDLDSAEHPNAVSEMYISGGSFDGLIKVSEGCKLEISDGTFINTALTIDQFKAFVKSGHTVQEINGAFIVK